MDRELRHALADGLSLVVCLVLAVGPPAVLLWSWRRWGSRRRLAIHAALLPVAVFVLAGAAGTVAAVLEIFVFGPRGWTGVAGQGRVEYVISNYWEAGVTSLAVAGMAALAWGPAALFWRWLDPSGFCRLTRGGPGRPRSPAEQDYGEPAAGEPGAAPIEPRITGLRRPDPRS